jgi:hypothetical protein
MPSISLSFNKPSIITQSGFQATPSFTSTPTGSLTLVKQWGVTPNFRKKRDTFELPMNTYLVSRNEYWKGQGHYVTKPLTTTPNASNTTVIHGIGSGAWSTNGGLCTRPSAGALSAVQNRALLKVLLKIKDQQVNLAQGLAERHQTEKLVKDTIKRLVSAFNFLRRKKLDEALQALGAGPPSRSRRKRINGIWYPNGKRPAPKDEFRNGANVWLELQYGWRPLMNDLYESVKLITNPKDHSPRMVRCRATVVSYDNSIVIPALATSDNVQRVEKLVTQIMGSYIIWYSLPKVPRTLLELGFSNPALLAWELTPFSFVVDWFIPIGNALNSLDATTSLVFSKGCYSQKISCSRRVTATGRVRPFQGSPFASTTGYATDFSILKEFGRTALLGFPTPVFPDFKNPLGADHILNAIALLVSTFSGRK